MYMNFAYKRTWAQVDLDALVHNFNTVKEHCKSKICCVIKADAYGHGAVAVATLYQNLGADFLGVSNAAEALQLRENGINLPILILGFSPPEMAKTLAEQNISQCIYSKEQAQEYAQALKDSGKKLKIHIKVDTGMSRLGFYFHDENRDFNAVEEIKHVKNLECFDCEGLFTHFAAADSGSEGTEIVEKQTALFEKIKTLLSKQGINFKINHMANSGGALDYEKTHFDMVRVGIVLYGLLPSSKTVNKLSLKPALSLKAIVSHVKAINEGDRVSYAGVYTAKSKEYIATIPTGYADGYGLMLGQNGAQVLINGKRYPIVGRVCMDQMMALVDEDLKSGDIVTLMGKDGHEEISAEELAKIRNTINYEIICNISARVARVYVKDGKVVESFSYIY